MQTPAGLDLTAYSQSQAAIHYRVPHATHSRPYPMPSCSNTLQHSFADNHPPEHARAGSAKPKRTNHRRRTRRAGLAASFRGSVVLAGLLLVPGSSASSAQLSPADQPSTEPAPSPHARASLQPTQLPPPALHHNLSDTSPADYVCQPVGQCQPCPIDELTNPVCELYHNRRLVDCIYLGSSSAALTASILRNPGTYATGLMIHHTWIDHLPTIDSSSTPPPPTTTNTSAKEEGEDEARSSAEKLATRADDYQDKIGAGLGGAEFQTWEACERVVLKEQQDFYEFALCNLAIAAISLIVYGFRTKQLVIKQYGKLAARIGILPS